MRGASAARTGYTLSLSAALVWATTSIGIKYLLDHYGVPTLSIAFWRDVFIALACLAGLFVLKPRLLRVAPRDLRGFALTGMISIGLYHALYVLSIALNGVAVATVLIYTYPAFVTLGARVLFRERLRWSQVAALVLALLGCALLWSSPCRTNATMARLNRSVTPLIRKNSAYSRRRPVRARWANDQNRFPTYATVVATTVGPYRRYRRGG